MSWGKFTFSWEPKKAARQPNDSMKYSTVRWVFSLRASKNKIKQRELLFLTFVFFFGFNKKLFSIVSKIHPDYKSKLVPLQGDLQEPNMGLSSQDRQLLLDNVDIVFHSAATVRFDEPIRVAVQINIVGTKKVIQLCQDMKHLKVIEFFASLELYQINYGDVLAIFCLNSGFLAIFYRFLISLSFCSFC
jgi:hypothetical protein